MLRESLKLVTISKLLADGKISVRTSNCCFNAKFNSVFDIIEYQDSGQSFSNIRNAGRKTCSELEAIYKEYLTQTSSPLPIEIVNEASKEEAFLQGQSEIKNLIETDVLYAIDHKLIEAADVLLYLNVIQKDVLKEKFEELISNYSNRIKNRLTVVSFESYVVNYLFSPDVDLLNIGGLGKRSLNEIVDLKSRMQNELVSQINLSEEEISKLHFI